MAARNGIQIGPRQLFLLMQSLALAMDKLKGGQHYEAMSPENYRALEEAHELWLELEEQWDALSARDRKAAAKKPFDVR